LGGRIATPPKRTVGDAGPYIRNDAGLGAVWRAANDRTYDVNIAEGNS